MMGKITRNLEALSGALTEREKTRAWWGLAVAAFVVCGGLVWLCLLFQPHDLTDLGKQMIAVLAFVVCLAAVLSIGVPSEQQP